jgi:HEAT repeat protein
MNLRDHATELLAGLQVCLKEGPDARGPMQSLGRLAGDIPTRLLPAVDASLRGGISSFSPYHVFGWRAFGPSELAPFTRAPHAWPVLAIAASHWSGWVREDAVRGLGASEDGRAVPYLFVRLNDWVEEVQLAARAALAKLLRPAFAAEVISALPLVWRLARQRRVDHREIAARVRGFLQSPECAEAVRAGCGSPDRETRRACLEIELAGGRRQPSNVLGEALSDPDPAVRLWAAREVARALPVTWAQTLALRALADRSVQIRRVALAALAPSLGEDQARKLLEAALLDTNTTARWQARALILQRGSFDLAAFYRRTLASATQPAVVRGALLGLGEAGKPDDLAFVTPFSSAERLSVRCAALRARADLEPLSSVQPYLDALQLPEPSFSKEARRALGARLAYVPVSILRALVVDHALPLHTRRNALSLAKQKSKWERLPVILDGCADPDEMVANMAVLLVDGWCARYNRSFLQPTPDQVAAASVSFARVSGRLSTFAQREIGHILSVLSRG